MESPICQNCLEEIENMKYNGFCRPCYDHLTSEYQPKPKKETSMSKAKLFLVTAMMVLAFLGGLKYEKAHGPQFNNPYTIIFEEITKADQNTCISDPNCMDISTFDEMETEKTENVAEGGDLDSCQRAGNCGEF